MKRVMRKAMKLVCAESTRATPRRGVLRGVEANLLEPSAACAFFFTKPMLKNCWKMKIKVTEYNTRSGPIRRQMSTCIKVMTDRFSPAVTVFEIFTFQNSSS